MTYKEAASIKIGDKIVQKMHGYIMMVTEIREVKLPSVKPYIVFICTTDDGSLMKEKHKDVSLPN